MTAYLPITTDRLTLRRYRDTDYDDLLKLQSNAEVTRFLLYDPKTPEEVKGTLAGRLADVAMDTDGQALTLAVELTGTGQYLGEVTLFVNSAAQRAGEIGYVFLPESAGHGYAGEAAKELLRLGFEHFGWHRMIARLDARNTGSVKLLERLGMRREAHFVRNEFLKGDWTDELVYALLTDEWPDKK
ncbi:GNAT family N-acetyltransferase [Kribbella italica]|uniref:RimJ/RimL family protein N-acetyltransferase n=1 Tax=Kribbella italica TaxID=1540520 RepID=A0A7W9MXR9_9ACTN|nr:GNAT family protein [Kribbella italica]MBB5840421.1 RimJ/RimL family protein N-acetyltransferase [Kribbella italica]